MTAGRSVFTPPSGPMLGVLLLFLGGCIAARGLENTATSGRDIIGPLAASVTSNIEKTDRVENAVAENAEKIEHAIGMIQNRADPVQTIVYGIIALLFMAGMLFGGYKLVEFLLLRAACRFDAAHCEKAHETR